MCGIAGVVGQTEPATAERAVRRMVAALARRGPDSEGIERWDEAVLGHRRLAIFDLSEAGRQPMVSSDRSIGVVFNGAIYNYRELRQELTDCGYVFASRTDTEVLIHGYREWGVEKLVARLRGMFAIGLWDDRLRKLFLMRDRLGVKPLVFVERNGALAFASTVRALRTAGFVSDVDENAVLDFLELGFVPDDRSIYRGSVKVPAGTIVEWYRGTVTSHQYWAPPVEGGAARLSFHDAVDETERLLLDAVAVRLHADVPVATLLSGGVDSSLVCWAVTKLGGNLTAYTIGTPGDAWDETADAVGTARALGIEHRVLPMSDGDIPEIEELVTAYAEPFASASALGMLRVSRTLASSAKVLLTGDGGDDVFLGYPEHRHLWLADRLSGMCPSAAKRWWRYSRSVFPRIGPLRRAAALSDYVADGLSAYVGNADGLRRYKAHGILGARLLGVPHDRSLARWSIEPKHRALADLLEYARKTYFVGEFMTKVDGATMHYGLEARSPFLDQVLWEFASSLPFDLRLRRGRLKAILRELVRRRIGERIARRRKRGFGVPVQRWIGGRWWCTVEAAFRDSILTRDGWIYADAALTQLQSAVRRGEAPVSLWYLYVLESWMKHEQRSLVVA
jgi:asparagine synthase (glutamine-hydrolysing)